MIIILYTYCYYLLPLSLPLFPTQSYERMNLCDALIPKRYSKGDLIIKEVSFLLIISPAQTMIAMKGLRNVRMRIWSDWMRSEFQFSSYLILLLGKELFLLLRTNLLFPSRNQNERCVSSVALDSFLFLSNPITLSLLLSPIIAIWSHHHPILLRPWRILT